MPGALSAYLDLLRLLAALVVFCHHASYDRLGGHWLSSLAGYGHEAVVVFFVLSGFVIALVRDTKEKTLVSFTISRVARLVSVAWPAILLSCAMDALGRPLAPQLYEPGPTALTGLGLSAIFANEFWVSGWHPGSNIPFWSLSYEAAYYLLFAIATYLPQLRVPLIVAAFLVGPKILLLLPAWLMGVFAYRLVARDKDGGSHRLAMWGGLALALAIAVPKLGNQYLTWRWEAWLGHDLFQAMGHSDAFVSDNLIAVGIAAHVVGVARWARTQPRRPAVERLLNAASTTTFPIYLLHYPALHFFRAVTLAAGGALADPFTAVAALGFSIALTPPCEWLRRRIRRAGSHCTANPK